MLIFGVTYGKLANDADTFLEENTNTDSSKQVPNELETVTHLLAT